MRIYQILFVFSVFFLMNSAFSLEAQLVDEKRVQEKIKAVENIKGLDDKGKEQLLERYQKTLDSLDSIKTNNQKSQNYRDAIKQAPEKIKVLEKKLEKLEKKQAQEKSSEQVLNSLKKLSLPELEQLLASESANLEAVKAKNSDLNLTLIRETESAPEIRKQLIETNQTLELRIEDKSFTPTDGTAEQKKSKQWLLDSQITDLRSKLKMLDLQLLSQSVRLQLLELQKEKSDHDLKKIRIKAGILKQQVDLQRSLEIQETQQMTQAEEVKAQGKHALIQSFAKLNADLSEEISLKTQELSQIESGDEAVYKETKRLSEEQASTKRKLEIAGLSQILGQVLLEQKKALPDSSKYLKALKKREKLIAESGLQHIQLQEELHKIKTGDEYLLVLMKDVPPDTQLIIRDDLRALLKTRKNLLKKAISIIESYVRAIGELDFAEKKLLSVADSYAELLDEHLLWLRSAPVFNLDNIKDIPGQVVFFLLPSKWGVFSKDLFHVLSSSIPLATGLLLVVFLFIKKRRFKELLINTGKKTKRISKDSLLHTFKAIYYTLLLAMPLPFVLFLFGWQLSKLTDVSDFSQDMASGMLFIILPLFYLQIFRYLCIPGGVAEIHFKWSRRMIDNLRKEMGRLMLSLLPALFITAVLISKGESSVNGGLGRLALLVTLLTIATFSYRLLKSGTGFLSIVAENNPRGLFARFQIFWFVLSLMVTMSLMALTIAGYVYTAGQLTSSLVSTVWFIFALIIMQQMSIRWLLLTRRRYALQVAYEKRKLAQELKSKQADVDSPGNDSEDREHVIEFEEPEIDMVSLSEDSSQLLNLVLFILGIAGLIAIWSNLFPALGIFEQVVLWHHTGIIDGGGKILPVTLSDLALAVLIAVVTISGGRHLPAIIEILLIQNTSMISGNRYTITTLINYSIVGIGFFSIFNILGADWARFQWLFAALSVGIGFGLQEIVANFISGIIILFERPIRVGDYVSVGDNEGIVSRIQIRATTIMTRDRKELLVPNKEFITGQLLNWSLSDPTTRLIIPVGVAYGSDIPRARDLMLEAAQENERVSDEPVPQVLFFNFGDNTLDLQLRCFIPDVDFRLKTTSELNEAINDKFNAAGISIAFPQRDVHLDINQPIDVRVQGTTI